VYPGIDDTQIDTCFVNDACLKQSQASDEMFHCVKQMVTKRSSHLVIA